MEIELLVIPDCPNEAEASEAIATALADTYVRGAVVRRTVVSTEQEAATRGFTGSPSILINGRDPFERVGAPTGLACRVYPTPDGPRGVPSLRDLRRALKEAAAHPTRA